MEKIERVDFLSLVSVMVIGHKGITKGGSSSVILFLFLLRDIVQHLVHCTTSP